MSGSLPTNPAPAAVTIRDAQPTLVSTAHSLRRIVRSRGGQRWAFDVEWASLSRTQFDVLWAFLIAQRGRYETFTFTPPIISRAKGVLGGSPTVATSALGARAITMQGATGNITGWAKAGDYLKFGNHAKVYVLTQDVNTAANGSASVYFEPGLFVDVTGAALTLSPVSWQVARTEDVIATTVQEQRYSLAVSLLEVP